MQVIAKYRDSYCVEEDNGSFDYVMSDDLELCLLSGVSIGGCSLDGDKRIVFDSSVSEYSDADIEEEEEEIIEDEEEIWGYDDEELYTEEEYEEYDEVDDSEEEEEDVWEEFEEDEYDYIEGNVSKVALLYEYLNADQIALLKRYYLWYSRRIFKEGQHDPTLGMKSKAALQRKQKALDSLRNLGDMWEYAGFIDTGFDGGGECTLGHKLRYMHLAWDVTVSDVEETFFGDTYDRDVDDLISSKECIVFGIKCVSDFFEVDSECIQRLQRAQRESLKDMEEIYGLFSMGKAQEHIQSFGVMDEFMKMMVRYDTRMALADKETIMPSGYVSFYKQFRQAGIPLPRSLVYQIRNCFVGWNDVPFYGGAKLPIEGIFTKHLKELYPKVEEFIDDIKKPYRGSQMPDMTGYIYYSYLVYWFVYSLCGYYEYDGELNHFEGGRGKAAKYDYHSLCNCIKSYFFSDFDFTYEYLQKVSDSYFMIQKYRETYNEVYNLVRSWEYNDLNERLGRRGKFEAGFAVEDAFTKCAEALSEVLNIKEEYEKREAEKEAMRLKAEEEARRKELEVSDEVEDARNAFESGDTSRGTVESVSMDEAVDWLCNNPDAVSKAGSDFKFHKDVLETVKSRGVGYSSKQGYYLKQLYSKITGKEVQEGKSNGAPLTEKERTAVAYVSAVLNDITGKVCKTVLRTGHCTERQRQYVDEAIKIYNER